MKITIDSKWWSSNPGLRSCTPNTRAIFIDLLCLFRHQDLDTPGILSIDEKPLSTEQIATRIGSDSNRILAKSLKDLVDSNLIKVDLNGAYYHEESIQTSRRREVYKENGKKGGRPKKNNPVIREKTKKQPPFKKVEPELTEPIIPEHKYQIAIKNDYPTVAKLKKQLTYAEAIKLESFGDDIIYDVLRAMENKNGLTKTYSTVYLTANDWAKRRLNDGNRTQAAKRTSRTGGITIEDIQRRSAEAAERAKYLFADDPQGD